MSQGLVLAFGGMSFLHILMAFTCGILGAAVGGIPIFVIIGSLFTMAGAVLAAGGDAGFLLNVALGYGFGPIAFGGAAAAAAYAAKKGVLPSGGRDVVTPLMGLKRPDVLLVGGLFGIITALFMWLFLTLIPFTIGGEFWTSSLALALAPVLIIVRLVYGKVGLFGKVPDGEKRFHPTTGVWVPYQTKPLELLVIGFAAGVASAGTAILMPAGGLYLGFGISLMILVFLCVGMPVPIVHHVTIIAATAAVYSGSIIWGAVFGILVAFVGEFMANVFLKYGDTHIDPPMFSILVVNTLILLVRVAGVFTAIPLP